MAFITSNLVQWNVSPNPPRRGLPQSWGYVTTDNMAAVQVAGYFNLNEGLIIGRNTTWYVGDSLYCVCSDGNISLQIASVDINGLNVTTTAVVPSIPAGSITTNMLANLAVTAAKIANGTITTTQINAAAGILGTQLAANTISTTQLNPATIQYLKVPMTAAQWIAQSATPFQIIAPAGAHTIIMIDSIDVETIYGGTAFTAGSSVAAQYGNAAAGAGDAASTSIGSVDVNQAFSEIISMTALVGTTPTAAMVNTGIFLSCGTPFATGNGTFNIHTRYHVLPTTV